MASRRPSPRKGNSPPRRGGKPGGPPRGPQARRRPAGPPASTPARPGPGRRPEPGATGGGPDRLQKVLAHAGVGSRRACEELILQGRVTVDNQVVRELGTRVDPRRQKVALDGQAIHAERNVYYAVNKPKGYVATNNDPAGKPRVVDLLPEIPQRVYAVGRLDEQSTGLMLLTNDGELANRLSHPRFGVEKVYRVVVAGEPAREVLDQLTQGVWLAEGKVRAKRVRMVGRKGLASVMEMVLAEGKNREIRRMLARFGHKVMSLTRIAVGPIGLKGLGVGEYRTLSAEELDLLRKVAAGMPVPTPRYPDRRPRIPRQTSPGRPPVGAGPRGDGGQPPARSARPPAAGRPATGPRPAHGGRPRPPVPGHAPPPAPAADRRSAGPRPAGPGRPPQGGPGPGPQHGRPPQGGPAPRPQQSRPLQGGPPARAQQGRPPQGGPAPRPQRGRPPGPFRGRVSGPPPAGPAGVPPSRRPRATTDRPDDGPGRKIIGLEPAPAPQRPGPPRPRPGRPGPRRAPRAAHGVKRTRRPDAGNSGGEG